MNKTPILEIEPKELKFIFELKKQCSCSVQLTNNTYHHVAFKIKTTSPRKYSVRPNVGVLAPKSTCEFIVTMQAQKAAPEEMVCKDKFLIQSTLVPAETTGEDVTASLFVKDGLRYVEENKLKVALISPPNSPELAHVNGDSKNRQFDHEKVQIYSKDEIQSPEPMVLKNSEHNKVHEVMIEEDVELKAEYDMGLDTIKDVEDPKEEASLKVSRDKELNTVKDVEELKPHKKIDFQVSNDPESIIVKSAAELKLGKAELKASKDLNLNTINNAEEPKPEKQREIEVSKGLAVKAAKTVEEQKPEKEADVRVSKGIEELKLLEAIEGMKLKLDGLESRLNESGVTISKLTEERRLSNQETKILQEKLAELISKGPRKVQVGFPLLYVCMVALICVFLGYRLHS